ncbi:MAG: protein BatD [Alistipes sp.]|nr:protein BatD [Candidatus Minthomonas equi]
MMNYKKLLLLPILLVGIAAMAQNLEVDAPTVVTDAEIFKVVYTATGKVDGFNNPDFSNFQVLAGPSQSTMSSTNIINGKVTQSYQVSFTFMLQASAVGKYTISPATVEIDGKTVSSRSVTIEVVKDTDAASAGSQGQHSQSSSSKTNTGVGDIQLRLSLNKTSVVKGEPVIATLKLYSRASISGFEDVRFPSFDGFWNQEIETPQNVEFRRETLNGTIYDAALLRKWMLLPQKSGEIVIDPAELVCAVQVRNSSSAGRSIFDDFFDSYETVRKRVTTPAVQVNVKDLPSGAPKSFTGGVGSFQMNVKVTPESVKSHEAASLVVTISGTGNINLIDAPSFAFPPDFEAYDVKRSENVRAEAGGTSGTKSFEYPFIPRSHGEFAIGPVEFSYYNVKTGKYETLSSGGIPFTVEKGSTSDAMVMSSGSDKQSVRVLGEDIRFIRTAVPALNVGAAFMVASPLMLILLSAAVLIFIILSLTLKKYMKMKADVAGVRNRKANSVARARLKNAGSYLKQNLPSAFYEELHRALEGYVSDKFRLTMTDLNRDTIRQALVEAGRSEEMVTRLLALLDACDYARYAPSSQAETMENHYKEAMEVISGIEKQ